MTHRKQLFPLITIFFLLAVNTYAQIPTADTIPDNLETKDKGILSSDRSELMNEYSSLNSAISSHDANCSRVADTDQTLIATCSSEMQNLQAKVQAYQTKLTEFNNLLKQTATTQVNTNSNVVDARNVPSGLPRSIDDAITSAYEKAPAGVSDRVRKGFQAVMTHDWALAHAWLEDALNHDPDNAYLKKFVKLADFEENNHSFSPSTVKAKIQSQFLDTPSTEPQTTNDYMWEQLIKMTENDPGMRRTNEQTDSNNSTKVVFPHN